MSTKQAGLLTVLVLVLFFAAMYWIETREQFDRQVDIAKTEIYSQAMFQLTQTATSR